jgi:CubicO group peptidase (beta-lactamase class C family)
MATIRLAAVACLLAALLGAATAQGSEPRGAWERTDPAGAGLSGEIASLGAHYVAAVKPTALVIVRDGRIAAAWGDPAKEVDAASVRKSLLGALFGIAIAKGRIRLDATLAELGIDDKAPKLTEAEKRATVGDLLKARSGIYHRAAHETADMRSGRPERGSHPPGAYWFYNNWDFNALGSIYRWATGEDIFESFDQQIARPIGMEDFSPTDGRYDLESLSDHPAYPFRLSARDLARFGVLFLNGGKWRGRQIVPAAWIAESTRPHSATDRGRLGYGYLWWTLRPDLFGEGAAMASGYGGQKLAIIPAKRLVVVQTVARRADSAGIGTSGFVELLQKIAAAAN